jgi:hypothetical protein
MFFFSSHFATKRQYPTRTSGPFSSLKPMELLLYGGIGEVCKSTGSLLDRNLTSGESVAHASKADAVKGLMKRRACCPSVESRPSMVCLAEVTNLLGAKSYEPAKWGKCVCV